MLLFVEMERLQMYSLCFPSFIECFLLLVYTSASHTLKKVKEESIYLMLKSITGTILNIWFKNLVSVKMLKWWIYLRKMILIIFILCMSAKSKLNLLSIQMIWKINIKRKSLKNIESMIDYLYQFIYIF